MKFLLVITSILLLTSCASTVTSIKQDKIKVLAQDTGYLLLGIQTNLDLKSIRISGPKNIELSSNDIKSGSNYFLLDLPAGNYTIDQVKLNNYWRRDLDDDEFWQFEVQSGKVNYVGHFEVVTWGYWYPITKAELVNQASEALEFMEEKFPNIIANRTIAYGGPGQDGFFDFLVNFNKD